MSNSNHIRPNWYTELAKTGTPKQVEAVRTELIKASALLVDFVVRDTAPVLTGNEKVLDVSISRPTTWGLPKSVRGSYGRSFSQLWVITACNVSQDLMAGVMEVTSVADSLMLQVAFEIVLAAAEMHAVDYLPPRWEQTVGLVMAAPAEKDGSFTPVWTDLVHELEPPEWFMPKRKWTGLVATAIAT